MPSPRDITGELTHLPKRRLKTDRSPAPPTAPDPRPKGPALRGMAFDPVIWLTGMLFLAAVGAQFAFLIWMW